MRRDNNNPDSKSGQSANEVSSKPKQNEKRDIDKQKYFEVCCGKGQFV